MLLHTFFKSCRMFREGGGSPYSDHDGDGGDGEIKESMSIIYILNLNFSPSLTSILQQNSVMGFHMSFFKHF